MLKCSLILSKELSSETIQLFLIDISTKLYSFSKINIMWMDAADSSVICKRNCSENDYSLVNYSMKNFMLSHEIFIWLRETLFITFGNLHSQGSDLIITSLKRSLFRNKTSSRIKKRYYYNICFGHLKQLQIDSFQNCKMNNCIYFWNYSICFFPYQKFNCINQRNSWSTKK